jgi:hypothetical protein
MQSLELIEAVEFVRRVVLNVLKLTLRY